MPDPLAAFAPRSIDQELAANPEADQYINDIAQLTVDRGYNPSWAAVLAGLAEYGIKSTSNPVKRVVESRANALR